MPGLIPGASQGKGLGLEFLRHVERCAVLVHVIDWPRRRGAGPRPVTDLDVIEAELAAYRPHGAAWRTGRGSSCSTRSTCRTRGSWPSWSPGCSPARGLPVCQVSAATHEGLRELAFAMADGGGGGSARRPRRGADPARDPARARSTTPSSRWSPGAATPSPVRGDKPGRWVRQTDFSNDEAVGYLADRLARLGVEEALVEAGARPAPRS